MSHSPRQLYPTVEGGRLGGLPILRHYFDLLQIRKTIDSHCPPAREMKITHGEAIEGLLFSIFQGDHRLYCVNELLEQYDLKVLFGRSDIQAGHFHDERLGKALDAFNLSARAILGEVSVHGLRLMGKPVKALIPDTTSISVYGEDYEERIKEGVPFAFPIFGFSKDHRPDLRNRSISPVYLPAAPPAILTSTSFCQEVFHEAAAANTRGVAETPRCLEKERAHRE